MTEKYYALYKKDDGFFMGVISGGENFSIEALCDNLSLETGRIRYESVTKEEYEELRKGYMGGGTGTGFAPVL